jgi:glycerate-2-kinase
VINLIISDVPGDDPSTIGSGPTVPDPSTLDQAHTIVKRYLPGITLPKNLPETPKPGEFDKNSPQNHWISTPLQGAKIAAKLLNQQTGIKDIWVDPQAYQGSLASVLQHLEQSIERGCADPGVPQAFIFHGESEIQVKGQGMGGRNQHLALQFAFDILPKWSNQSIALLSFGTDGVDGNSPAAGALVDQETLAHCSQLGRDPRDYLERFDAYHFFAGTPYLIQTGPTGNNLMDLQVVVWGNPL